MGFVFFFFFGFWPLDLWQACFEGEQRRTEDGMLLYLPLLGRSFATFFFDRLPKVCNDKGLKVVREFQGHVWEQIRENERVNGY